MDIPDKATAASGKLEALKNIDIQGELNSVVELRLTVAFLAAPFLTPAGLDIPRNIAARPLSQEIRITKQVIGANAATVNEGITTPHRLKCQPLSLGIQSLGKIRD